mmetsp:Transcript_7283/g.14606  ORF Transcript_7283/g.14606 Transcript_7283/m.14606 type:complete len:304 (-) Transcript_7283:2604-3515(-)
MSRALELSKKFKNSGTEVSKVSKDKAPTNDRVDDVDDEKERLQEAGWRCGMVSSTRWMSTSSPGVSKQMAQANEKDIIKKGTVRKGRVLCLFGDKIRPMKGGKLGVLKDLDTKCPSLHMEFPEGTIKFHGTILFPKNKYLSLKLGSKDIVCEDVFESVVLFSEVTWILKESSSHAKDETLLYQNLPASLVKRSIHDFKPDEMHNSRNLEDEISDGSEGDDLPTQHSKTSVGRKRRNRNTDPIPSQRTTTDAPNQRGRRQSARGAGSKKKPKYTSDHSDEDIDIIDDDGGTSSEDEIDLCSSDE